MRELCEGERRLQVRRPELRELGGQFTAGKDRQVTIRDGLAAGDAGSRLSEFTTFKGTKVHATNRGRNDVERMIGGANDSNTVDEDRRRHLEVSPALLTLRLHTMKKGKSTEATDAAHGGGDFDGTTLVLSGAADTARFNDKGGSNDGGYGPSAAASCEKGDDNTSGLRGERTTAECFDVHTAQRGARLGDRRSASRRGAFRIRKRRDRATTEQWIVCGGAVCTRRDVSYSPTLSAAGAVRQGRGAIIAEVEATRIMKVLRAQELISRGGESWSKCRRPSRRWECGPNSNVTLGLQLLEACAFSSCGGMLFRPVQSSAHFTCTGCVCVGCGVASFVLLLLSHLGLRK